MSKNRSGNACDSRDGDGDGSDGHCYRFEVVMFVIDMIAIGDGHCFRIEAVMHVIDVMTMVMDIVLGMKL